MNHSTAAPAQQATAPLDPDRLPVRWWTILNQMRLRGELPPWVRQHHAWAGSRADMAVWRNLQGRV